MEINTINTANLIYEFKRVLMLTNPLWELYFLKMFWGFLGEWRLTQEYSKFSVQQIDCIAQMKAQHLGNTIFFHLLMFSSNKWDWSSSMSLPGCFRVGGEEGKDRRRCNTNLCHCFVFLSSHNLILTLPLGSVHSSSPPFIINLLGSKSTPELTPHCGNVTPNPLSTVCQLLCANIYSQTSATWLNPSLVSWGSSLAPWTSLYSFVVETIIFIRHAGNLWNIFNSSLIPPTHLYHAKMLPFVFLQNHEMFSCLKAKTYHKNLFLQLAFLCQISLKSPFSSTSVLKLFHPRGLDGFRSSKLESALQHFLHSAHKQETKLASFPHPPRLPLPATPFLFTACNNLPNPSFLWCHTPHRLLFIWSLCFTSVHTRVMIKSLFPPWLLSKSADCISSGEKSE